MTFSLGADLREIMPCPRCHGAHLVVQLHRHATPLRTECGPLTHWFECPRTQQQVACTAATYPLATVENVKASMSLGGTR